MQFVFPYACIAFWGYWFAPCGPFSFVPGALYTSSFRHKTRKQPFQILFKATVVVNIAGLAWLATSPESDALLAELGRMIQ